MKSLNYFLYNSNDGAVSINAIVKDETIWLTQKTMGELFDVNTQAITKHLENIFKEGELEEPATCSILEQVQTEGHRQVVRKLKFYNLDAIISVGYRVNSRRYQILPDHGKISMEKAREKASLEYDEFNKTQKILSDFDKSLKNRLKEGDKK